MRFDLDKVRVAFQVSYRSKWRPVVGRLLLVGALWLSGAESVSLLGAPPQQERLAAGKTIYDAHCLRCHGETGDSLGYPEILPLTGITKRHSYTEIAELSAPFVGKTFRGDEAQALAVYLGTLPGEKGFAEPGWLFSPYLLRKKAGSRGEFRVLDARPRASYKQGHVSNAVSWTTESAAGSSCLASPVETVAALARFGVDADMFVVVYDDQGGPEAACVWWSLTRLGFPRVALLDGGWNRWKAEGYPAVTSEPRIEAAANPPKLRSPQPAATAAPGEAKTLRLGESSGAAGEIRVDWRQTVGENGFRTAAEIRTYLDGTGLTAPGHYRVAGPADQLSHLVFVLHLLGDESAAYDPDTQILSLGPIE